MDIKKILEKFEQDMHEAGMERKLGNRITGKDKAYKEAIEAIEEYGKERRNSGYPDAKDDI
jgi:hypothetical protein